jgi:hypothetical protein
MTTKQIEYNVKSAQKYNWSPDWFGCFHHDEKLITAIIEFQKSMGIDADGLVGPMTFRRLYTHRESRIDPDNKHLIFGGNLIPIKWSKVTTYKDDPYWSLPDRCLSNQEGKPRRKINLFMNHWDVCLNSRSTHKILKSRFLSVHLYVTESGRVIQTTDLQNICWHAGNRSINARSIGVEINTAWYPKYQNWYIKNHHGPRPIVSGARVHGKTLPDFLGFYPIQLQALRAVWQCVSAHFDIPLRGPDTTTIHKPIIDSDWSGICHHYHAKKSKIDVAGYDINEQIDLYM